MNANDYLLKYFNIHIDDFVSSYILDKYTLEDVINISYILNTSFLSIKNFNKGHNLLTLTLNNKTNIDLSLSPTATTWFYSTPDEVSNDFVEVTINNITIYCEIPL